MCPHLQIHKPSSPWLCVLISVFTISSPYSQALISILMSLTSTIIYDYHIHYHISIFEHIISIFVTLFPCPQMPTADSQVLSSILVNPPFFTTLISIFSCPHLSAQSQTSPIPACRVIVGSRLLARSLGHTTKGRDWAGMGRGGKTLLGSGLGNPGGPPGRRGPNSTEGWGWGGCSVSPEMPDCICFIAPEITQRKPKENRAAGWRLRGLGRAAGASRGGNTGRAPGPPGLGDGGYGTSELRFTKGPETWMAAAGWFLQEEQAS